MIACVSPSRTVRSTPRRISCWAVQEPAGLGVTPRMCTRGSGGGCMKSPGVRGRPMASTREWFETVEEARRRARRRLPRSVYLALVAGTEKGVTLRDNTAAFSELRFAPPHIADLPATREMATSVLGQEIALPVIASPTGVRAVHP